MSVKCLVCNSNVQEPYFYDKKGKSMHIYSCQRCGDYHVGTRVNRLLPAILNNDNRKIAILSHWIRAKHEKILKSPPDEQFYRDVIILDEQLVENVIKRPPPSSVEQADNFIRWIGDNIKGGGQYIDVNKYSIIAIIGVINEAEFYFIFNHLKIEGLIESKTAIGKGDTVLAKVTLSFKGLKYYQELKQGILNSKKECKTREYKFKNIKLSNAERVWLTEILKSNFSKIDAKSLRVKLWEKLPKDFTPNKIDCTLVRNNRLTLIGLWHVDPNNLYFSYVSKTIDIIKGLIKKNTSIKEIKANEIANLVGISEREAEIVLMLIDDLGGFFGGGGRSSERCGFTIASFPQNDLGYDEFLRFENLDKTIEQFYVRYAPKKIAKKRYSSKGQTMPISRTIWEKPSNHDIWNDIYEDFEVKKLTFAKKINFVNDEFKRKIIFRDIEHAYLLAKNGFAKPAVILAGSVIEELLRLYLKTKNVKPAKNTFEEYIKACEQKQLLKSGIYRLSDSIRHFRNLVHLEKEKTQKHKTSKATAKSAVASIFIVSNDFQKSSK